ncbi:DUF3060 domain-containing protein [Nocardioides sp. GXQ0305]|uniref:DUF3060 domain-containing protein n=1 Tax=Nocardioides sp. GXQ0305 TaxID=3423912 RepID=UPI003D7E3B86
MSRRRLATVTAGLLVALGLPAATAEAVLPLPVDCSHGPVELRWDGLTYDLDGTCGRVSVLADDAVVRIPTATRVVVRGHGNTVVTKSVDTLVVRGRNQEVRPAAVRVLRVASPRTTVAVEGLVESAQITARRATVTADRVSRARVPGSHNALRTTGRGYDASVGGDHNTLRYRHLDSLAVSGDDNSVRVRAGRTAVHDDGNRNRVRVRRR